MKYDVISFDLQGTLTDSTFSDEFWLEVLPQLYSRRHNMRLDRAKDELREIFARIGKYEYRYYSLQYWLDELGLSTVDALKHIKHRPRFFADTRKLIGELKNRVVLVIITSATTEFIDHELGDNKKYFKAIYSTLDDFNIPGKPAEVYARIAQDLGVPTNRILHIGDSKEMDVDNARRAGCATFFFDHKSPRDKNIRDLRNVIESSLCQQA